MECYREIDSRACILTVHLVMHKVLTPRHFHPISSLIFFRLDRRPVDSLVEDNHHDDSARRVDDATASSSSTTDRTINSPGPCNMHSADFQGYRFCTFSNIPFNVLRKHHTSLRATF